MKTTADMYARALFEAISDTDPKDHDRVVHKFAELLAARGDLSLEPAIGKAFAILAEGDTAELTTRNGSVDKKLMNELNVLAKSTLDVTQHSDASMVGGAILRSGDVLVDASLKTQLEQLREHMQS